jgi:hypothetical protein
MVKRPSDHTWPMSQVDGGHLTTIRRRQSPYAQFSIRVRNESLLCYSRQLLELVLPTVFDLH